MFNAYDLIVQKQMVFNQENISQVSKYIYSSMSRVSIQKTVRLLSSTSLIYKPPNCNCKL